MKKYVKLSLSLVTIVALAACAGPMKELPDGKVLAMATVGDTPDRSSSYTALYQKAPDGRLVQIDGRLDTGPTVGGQMMVGVTQGMGAALVQGVAGLAIADKKQCNGIGCGGPAIVNQVSAGAQALSNATSGSEVTIAGSACGNKPCATVPMH